MEKLWESERLTIKMNDEGTSKDLGTSGSAQNLRIVSFVRKDNEEKEKKYSVYAKIREERNLRSQALRQYVFGISKE